MQSASTSHSPQTPTMSRPMTSTAAQISDMHAMSPVPAKSQPSPLGTLIGATQVFCPEMLSTSYDGEHNMPSVQSLSIVHSLHVEAVRMPGTSRIVAHTSGS